MGTLRATEVFNQAGLRLIAIESVELQQSKMDLGYQMHAHLNPLALIIYTSDGVYAVDMQAQSIAVEQLLEKIPELKGILAPSDNP